MSIDFTARERLPIWQYRQQIIESLNNNQVIIIAGETGSGKTTQLPQFCYQGGFARRCLGITQPRRIAATALARRLAAEMQVQLGNEVGYKIRFQQQLRAKTRIKVMTDGILLTELQQDRLLRRYDTLIIDEAHERSLNIDFLLAMAKEILSQRQELRLLVTSATIDTEKFSHYFNDAPIITVAGRSYPVELRYREPSIREETTAAAVSMATEVLVALDELLSEGDSGDVLVFMATEADIHETCRLVSGRWQHLEVLPLFARLTPARQQQVFKQSGRRRVIVSTNIAETSLTIPGIRYVIDSGQARIGRYHSSNATFSLLVSPIPQSSADQRAGRCGRLEDGICIRLYSEADYQRRPRYLQPEIQRANLAAVILQLLQLQLQPGKFELLDMPSRAAFSDGFRTLKELQAIKLLEGKGTRAYTLTELGRQLVRLPLDPRLAAVLLQASKENVLAEALLVVTIIGMHDARERPLDAAAEADKIHKRFNDIAFARRILPTALVKMLPILEPASANASSPKGSQATAKQGKLTATTNGDNKEPLLSDALSLLVLWYYNQNLRQKLSKNQWRKTCQREFLSANRLQEWHDSQQQISQLMKEAGFKVQCYAGNDLEQALYCSLAKGFLSHLGQRQQLVVTQANKTNKNTSSPARVPNNYLFAYKRQARIHPGSSLFQQPPSWIIAIELVQTSALYGRCVFPVKPKMLINLADELCQRRLFEPHWSRNSGKVMAKEKVSLFGFVLDEGRRLPYASCNRTEAQSIFIREALLLGDLHPSDLQKLPFIQQNIESVTRAQNSEERLRRRGMALGEEGLFQFYQQLFDDTSIVDCNSLQHFAQQTKAEKLFISSDYLYVTKLPDNFQQMYPDKICLGDQSYPLDYQFQPGEASDGVSLRVPIGEKPPLASVNLSLLVPGYLEESLRFLLHNLPKSKRRQLVPLQQGVNELLPQLHQRLAQVSVLDDTAFSKLLSKIVLEQYDLAILPINWPLNQLPEHLKIRLSLRDPQQQEIVAARDLLLLRQNHIVRPEQGEWQQLRQQWQQQGLNSWPSHALPVRLQLRSGILYPALVIEPLQQLCQTNDLATAVYIRGDEQCLTAEHCNHDPLFLLLAAEELAISKTMPELRSVALHLFEDQSLANYYHQLGCAWLLAWQQRKLLLGRRQQFSFDKRSFPPQLWGGVNTAARLCFSFALQQVLSCNARSKEELLEQSKLLGPSIYGQLSSWLAVWQEVINQAWRLRLALDRAQQDSPHHKWLATLERRWRQLLDPLLFSLADKQSGIYIWHLPRYLQGLAQRLERGLLNPVKDATKQQQLQPILDRYQQDYQRAKGDVLRLAALRACLWQLEELQLATFAPELRLRTALSSKQLKQRFDEIRLQG